jgi:hypothetical protein
MKDDGECCSGDDDDDETIKYFSVESHVRNQLYNPRKDYLLVETKW